MLSLSVWHKMQLRDGKQVENHSFSKTISISKDLVFVGMSKREREIRETSLHQTTSPWQ